MSYWNWRPVIEENLDLAMGNQASIWQEIDR